MRPDSVNHISLVTNMARGDQRAATRLYDDCSPVLYALAYRITGDAIDAEEVVLEAFMQAWNSAKSYHPERSSVLSWLSMITRTRALDHVRARSRRTRAVLRAVTVMGDEPIGISTSSVMLADHLAEEEQVTEVARALEQLPNTQRAAIELAYFTNLTHLEIAERLGAPLGTVKTRIRLAVDRMRNTLAGDRASGDAPPSTGRFGWAR